MADMGEQAAEGADNPDEQQSLEAARSLLERNGELVFKLNGLAALRRTAGGRTPSAEEQALLAEAQRSLQDAASLLPPRILVSAGLTKRLRQQLQPAAAGHAADGEGTHKRRLVVTQLKEGQGDARQAAMDGLHLDDALAGLEGAQPADGDQRKQEMEQLEGLLFANRARLASAGQQGQRGQQQAEEAPPLLLQQREAAGQGSSGAPPEGLQPLAGGAAALAGSPWQQLGGGTLSQAFLHGLRPQPSLGDLLGSGSLVAPGSGRLSGDLGLLPLPALSGGAPLAAPEMQQQAVPRPGDPALGGERLAGEDAFLLSKAYGSMTTEQKERLASQPPEVRQYVLRERMRRTREQLQVMQGQPAADSAGETAPPSRLASEALQQSGLWPGDAALPAGQQQDGVPGVGQSTSPTSAPGSEPQGGAAQQQLLPLAWQQHLAQQAVQPSTSPPPDLGFTADSQLLQQEQQQRALPQQEQQQRALPPRLASLGQLGPGTLAAPAQLPLVPAGQLGLGSAGLGALVGGSLGGMPPAGQSLGGGRLVAMDEEQRLAHLRSLKKRQEEWLEQQRLAAAQLAQSGGD